MPTLARPDGVEIHWEERGEGPTVLLAPAAPATPDVYAGLADELASDHRVITYDPRGSGGATRLPPADPAEDFADLSAVLEAAGGAAAAIALGDAGGRAASLAVVRPELLRSVVVGGASPVPPRALVAPVGPVASAATLTAMLDLSDRNFRAGLRGMLELTNPEMSADELRGRVDASLAYSEPEAILRRMRWYFEGSNLEDMRTLADRFWIAYWPSAWSPPDVLQELRSRLPDSHIETLAGGAISRPDLTADPVRRAARES